MSRKPKEKEYRVWIELEKPVDKAHGEELAELANNMLATLAKGERTDKFWWSENECQYCYGSDWGYTVCTDRGRWFNLQDLGRKT